MADHDLARTLSARYYLPGRILPNPELQSRPDASVEVISRESFVHRSTPMTSNRVSKRGRPRMSPSTTDTASHDRRTQVRHAQRTYRQKKETMFRDMRNRVSELQDTVERISSSLADFHEMAIQSDLHVTHPYLFDRLNETIAQVQSSTPRSDQHWTRTEDIHATNHPLYPTTTTDPDPVTFGYMINPEDQQDPNSHLPTSHERHRPVRFCHPLYSYHLRHIEKPLPGSSAHTHSLHETDFSRRLHRYCLEYTWRIFIDPHANAQDFYRIFRLVPCVRYTDKMRPYLECLVRSGAQESLDIAAAPFYCIGGAGTHYPRKQNGVPVYPENMRLPRRILSVMPFSGARDDKVDEASEERDALLKALGLHGIWLDCHDVQGYLEEKGLALDGPSCVYASGSGAVAKASEGVDEGVMDVDAHEESVVPRKFHIGDGTSVRSRTSDLTLNVEGFFRLLLKNMIILGRAPGFRLSDVETAFKSTAKLSAA
ncbi:hypothetical protein P170DRAFT_408131 [Aspergillus steynii IBT 23096]|uniref:BZIP domain-containing protein n=1 Tax=Aspergillus steynii IBT 23096 TaxID=1392250 RepID=A0A2I2G8G3_9EURO|nr:uncharacterized protein P170DRAFT_408131 [Aspergillus steynii IBT 23096]PLB49133.1 hypothetical protein P170DRAFT_408131 [Aspergillus steynii IBT 23096]